MAKKNVSVLISAAGWIGGLTDGLVRGLRQRGVADEDIHRLVTEDGQALVEKMVDVIASPLSSAKYVFRLLVNYDQPLEELVKLGKYNYVNSDITSNNFPAQYDGNQEVEILLVHFGKVMTGDQVLQELQEFDRMSLEPAGPHEILTLGIQKPDIQRQFPIISLRSVWQHPDGGRSVVVLWGAASGRGAGLDWFDRQWNEDCRFAALRRHPK